MVIIHNVTRYCDDIYECVASNGVPPTVSRQMRVTVECKWCYVSTVSFRHLCIVWMREARDRGWACGTLKANLLRVETWTAWKAFL